MALRGVPLTLGGREWTLRCTLGAMAAVEDRGTTWQVLLEKLKGPTPSFRAALTVIWAMLQDSDAPPTFRDVGTWIEPANFPEVLLAVSEALRAAFPAEQARGERPPKGRGTGTPSSVSPMVPSPSSPANSGV